MTAVDANPTEFVDPRTPRPPQADERTSLIAFLEFHRLTLTVKCRGLNPADLALQSVERSDLSLLGLIRHLAEGEQFWFRRVMAGENPASLFAEQNGAFNVAAASSTTVADAWQAWRAEVAFAEAFVATAPTLDIVGQEPGVGPVSLRWVLLHMIEEYARHNGHADLLREQIDGTVGQ